MGDRAAAIRELARRELKRREQRRAELQAELQRVQDERGLVIPKSQGAGGFIAQSLNEVGSETLGGPIRAAAALADLGVSGVERGERLLSGVPGANAVQSVLNAPVRGISAGLGRLAGLFPEPETPAGRATGTLSEFLTFGRGLGARGAALAPDIAASLAVSGSREAGAGPGVQAALGLAAGTGTALGQALPSLARSIPARVKATEVAQAVREGTRPQEFAESIVRSGAQEIGETAISRGAQQAQRVRELLPEGRLTIDVLTESPTAKGLVNIFGQSERGRAVLRANYEQTAKSIVEAVNPQATALEARTAAQNLKAQAGLLTAEAQQAAQRNLQGAQAVARQAAGRTTRETLELRGRLTLAQTKQARRLLAQKGGELFPEVNAFNMNVADAVGEAASIVDESLRAGLGAQRTVPVEVLDIVNDTRVREFLKAADAGAELALIPDEISPWFGKLPADEQRNVMQQLGILQQADALRAAGDTFTVPWQDAQDLASRLGAGRRKLEAAGTLSRTRIARLKDVESRLRQALTASPELEQANAFWRTQVAPLDEGITGELLRRGRFSDGARIAAEDVANRFFQGESGTAVIENLDALERVMRNSTDLLGVPHTTATGRQAVVDTLRDPMRFQLRRVVGDGDIKPQAVQKFIADHETIFRRYPELLNDVRTVERATESVQQARAVAETPMPKETAQRLASLTDGRPVRTIGKIIEQSETPAEELNALVGAFGGTPQAERDVNALLMAYLKQRFLKPDDLLAPLGRSDLPVVFDGDAFLGLLSRTLPTGGTVRGLLAERLGAQHVDRLTQLARISQAAKTASRGATTLQPPDKGLLNKFPSISGLMYKVWVITRVPSLGIQMAAGGDIAAQIFSRSIGPVRRDTLVRLLEDIVFDPDKLRVFLTPPPKQAAARLAWEQAHVAALNDAIRARQAVARTALESVAGAQE